MPQREGAVGGDDVPKYWLENWRLLWYRKDHGTDPRSETVASFILSRVLQDPNYRTISIFAGDYNQPVS